MLSSSRYCYYTFLSLCLTVLLWPSLFLSSVECKSNTSENTVIFSVLQFLPGTTGIDNGIYLKPPSTYDPSTFFGVVRNAVELFVATKLAIDTINADNSILPNTTLMIDYKNTYYDGATSILRTNEVIDPFSSSVLNDHLHQTLYINQTSPYDNGGVPPLILGLIGYDEAIPVAQTTAPDRTPLLSTLTSTPSLVDSFTHFSRAVPSDTLQAIAFVALFRRFGWKKIAFIYNTVGGTPQQTVNLIQSFGAFWGIETVISVSYTSSATNTQVDVTKQLQAIKDSGARLIFFSAFNSDVSSIMTQADALGIASDPYNWIGMAYWLFDTRSFDDTPRLKQILHGTIGLTQYIPKTSLYRQFMNKWNATFSANPAATLGLPMPNSVATLAYDSVYIAANATEKLLNLRKACGYNSNIMSGFPPTDHSTYTPHFSDTVQINPTYDTSNLTIVCPLLRTRQGQNDILTQLIRDTRAAGASGPIFFSQRGDRLCDFAVSNFVSRDETTNKTIQNDLVTVGIFNTTELARRTTLYAIATSSGVVNYSVISLLLDDDLFDIPLFYNFNESKIQWNDGTHHIPPDSPYQVSVIRDIKTATWVGVLVYAIIGYIYVFGILLAQLKFRKEKIIKISSPILNIFTCCGAILVLTYVILLGLSSNQTGVKNFSDFCAVKLWILATGFTLGFSPLVSKTYRLHVIFNSKRLTIQKIKNKDIMLFVFCLLAFDFVYMISWQNANPFYQSLTSDPSYLNPANTDEIITVSEEYCRSGQFSNWLVGLIAVKGTILLLGAYLSFAIRNISLGSADINDSKIIGLCIYNVAVASCFLILFSFFVKDTEVFYIICALALITLVLIVTSLLFLPKMHALYHQKHGSYQVTEATTDRGKHSTNSSEQIRKEFTEMLNIIYKLKDLLTQANSTLKSNNLSEVQVPVFNLPDKDSSSHGTSSVNSKRSSWPGHHGIGTHGGDQAVLATHHGHGPHGAPGTHTTAHGPHVLHPHGTTTNPRRVSGNSLNSTQAHHNHGPVNHVATPSKPFVVSHGARTPSGLSPLDHNHHTARHSGPLPSLSLHHQKSSSLSNVTSHGGVNSPANHVEMTNTHSPAHPLSHGSHAHNHSATHSYHPKPENTIVEETDPLQSQLDHISNSNSTGAPLIPPPTAAAVRAHCDSDNTDHEQEHDPHTNVHSPSQPSTKLNSTVTSNIHTDTQQITEQRVDLPGTVNPQGNEIGDNTNENPTTQQ